MSQYIAPASKILRHPELLTAIRAGRKVWPLNVELDPSAACNLRCRHCDFAYTHGPALLDLSLAERLFHELAAGGTKAVTFTGGGEPTMHPQFPSLAQAAAAEGLQLGLYTNGVNASRLLEGAGHFAWVYVSLDAATAEDWAAIKLPGSNGATRFWGILETIKRIVAERRDGRPVVGVGFLLTDRNRAYVPQMAALAADLGVDYCQFRPVVGLDSYEWVRYTLPLLEGMASEKVIVSVDRFRRLLGRTPRGYAVCRGSALVPAVGADGTVWACPNTRGLRRLGSLKEETFAAIWERRAEQLVGGDCRQECRNHSLNLTLDYVCGEGAHDGFV